ncbi:DODA-type extradiol aromatic ring-opening family dioxygenase [Agaribacterium haliotis]|uniref:DODA-type extradiol aromatic ring-opening family dioxygenase n=1 Tax=Agaribacterium haliotis TaxID=2013869 RepID=UPI000BB56CA2|nr:class III extradiol ring-cleavage dioxygenase [Agaribacterium haliotis]
MNTVMPSAFISHGSPQRMLEQSPARSFVEAFAKRLPRPRAILVISAHWQSEQLELTCTGEHSLQYDFWGFPPELNQVQYPARQSAQLSEILADNFQTQNIAVNWNRRALDHGAWSILKLAYADADIPVAAISLPTPKDASTATGSDMQQYYELGRVLKPLRKQQILLLGSGSATHNLAQLDWSGREQPWAKEFSQWLQQRVKARDDKQLCQLYHSHPLAQRAHPSNEHFLPLLVALGAAAGERAELIHDSMELGCLNNSSWLFGTC